MSYRPAAKLPYNRVLRVIGQSLESAGATAVSVKNSGNEFTVEGRAARSGLWRLFSGKALPLRLSFSVDDIERLESDGRARRRQPDSRPDFGSLSNLLRAVGTYLDSKGADLLEVNLSQPTVMILYQNSEGHPELEEKSVAALRNLGLQLCSKRFRRS
jgi:hypothetical protein